MPHDAQSKIPILHLLVPGAIEHERQFRVVTMTNLSAI